MMLTPASGPRSLAAPTSSDMIIRSSSPENAESAAAHGPTTTRTAGGPAEEDRLERLAELERAGDDLTAGELERKRSRLAVEAARDEREPHRRLAVHEAPGRVDEMQPAVLGHAVRSDLHLADLLQREALDGRD